MQYNFISYRIFEQLVANNKHCAGNFARYRHLLPAIPWRHRQRFLNTLAKGCDIEAAYDCLMAAQHLPDANYDRYLGYMQQTKLNKDNTISLLRNIVSATI